MVELIEKSVNKALLKLSNQHMDQKSNSLEQISVFSNAIEAMNQLSEDTRIPRLIILDVLLIGPNGFTFLNELLSYSDLSQIPVVIISSLNFQGISLKQYNVVRIFDKTRMYPADLENFLVEILGSKKHA